MQMLPRRNNITATAFILFNCFILKLLYYRRKACYSICDKIINMLLVNRLLTPVNLLTLQPIWQTDCSNSYPSEFHYNTAKGGPEWASSITHSVAITEYGVPSKFKSIFIVSVPVGVERAISNTPL